MPLRTTRRGHAPSTADGHSHPSAMRSLVQDARYAARALSASPGFALTAILSLALGIGANTAIFTLLDALVLRPLPVPHAESLVTIGDPAAVTSGWTGSP